MIKEVPTETRVKVKRVRAKSLLHEFSSHTLPVTSLAFSPSNGVSFHTLASTSLDEKVALHIFSREISMFQELEKKKEVLLFKRNKVPLNCAFDPGGAVLRILEETYAGDTEISFLFREGDGSWIQWPSEGALL